MNPELSSRRCRPCEGGVAALGEDEAADYLRQLPDWHFSADRKAIRRQWRVRDFAAALDFCNRIGRIAEEEDHHPDLHLTGYRNVTVELSTHALGGLSENDFILAAKIDQLPVELKK